MKISEPILKKSIPHSLAVEFRKIGYGLVVIGVIALVHAWGNIIQNEASWWELIFLFIGLIATLGGINLGMRYSNHNKTTLTGNTTSGSQK